MSASDRAPRALSFSPIPGDDRAGVHGGVRRGSEGYRLGAGRAPGEDAGRAPGPPLPGGVGRDRDRDGRSLRSNR
ncbi:MAG: hypothetical protein AVDCRST_MAG49-3821 [uncultured Thermomicrobiales bacterium]|uniref:Uncharacterized protein n=1 Tax=uncultured Thermomicrobiales bacterium TaxID=1645740 RepID=A0A6J4V9S7_9BACT|nr:MAG: hypothetical protein AVDCRST_MAG49-3821 [uncultured Thermomicrobiales bacterium]